MASRAQNTLTLAVLLAPLLLSGARTNAAEPAAGKPRILALPWVVIDRTTNQLCTTPEPTASPVTREAGGLARSAASALDAEMHRYGRAKVIPRKEWEPAWKQINPGRIVRQGAGCAVCAPINQLLQYDRASLQDLARTVRADYVWLGVTVIPLTRETKESRPDECCREALALERDAVLARSSALLVRVSDGEVVWERDARVMDREVPKSFPRAASNKFHGIQGIDHPPARHREIAVDATAHDLGKAFRREHQEGLQ